MRNITTTGNHISDYPYTPEGEVIEQDSKCAECWGDGFVSDKHEGEKVCESCQGTGLKLTSNK